MRLARVVLFAILTIAALSCFADPSRPERAFLNTLPKIPGAIPTWHSVGFERRAAEIQKMVEAEAKFYESERHLVLQYTIAVLTRDDYERLTGSSARYGVPVVRGSDHPFILMPAVDGGAIYEECMKALPKSSPETQGKVRDLGYTAQQACTRGVDICVYHEFGHRMFKQEKQGTPDFAYRWTSEFLASYYGYMYMKAKAPRDAKLWEALNAVVREGIRPTAKSLHEFEEFGGGFTAENYSWYQGQIQALVEQVYARKGTSFLDELALQQQQESKVYKNEEEVIPDLDRITPVFSTWFREVNEQLAVNVQKKLDLTFR